MFRGVEISSASGETNLATSTCVQIRKDQIEFWFDKQRDCLPAIYDNERIIQRNKIGP